MAEWLNPLIAAAAGLSGALIGAAAALRTQRREAEGRHEAEHRAALVSLWAAVNSFGLMYAAYGETMPKRKNWLTRLWHGLQISGYGGLLIERLWLVTDALWEATGRLRTVATPDDLSALNEIEMVLAQWEIGEPLPAEWSPAIIRLRELVESAAQADSRC